MNRFFKWVETKFSRHSAIVEAEELHIPVGVRVTPKENVEEEYSVEVAFDASVPGRVESHDPGKDVPMPDIYACDDTITQPQLNILDESSLDASESADSSESTGIDPYNSGSFDPSKTWKSRPRK